jgi:hypothetical protein
MSTVALGGVMLKISPSDTYSVGESALVAMLNVEP